MIEIEVFVENRYRHAFDNAIKKLDVKANIICEKETQTKGLGSYVNIRMSGPNRRLYVRSLLRTRDKTNLTRLNECS